MNPQASEGPPDGSSQVSHTLAPLPEAVTSFGAVTVGDWIHVCGGHRGERHDYTSETVSGSFHRLRWSGPAGGVWERLAPVEPAQGAPLVAFGSKIHRTGGMAARNRSGEPTDLHSKATVWSYDCAHVSAGWQAGPPMPEPRSSHDAVVEGGALYVGGGWQLAGKPSAGRWLDAVWRLDLGKAGAAWESIPQPFRRRALAMAAANGRIYFLGGIDAEGEPSSAVDVLDTGNGQWSRGPDLPDGPMKGFGFSALALGGKVYASGLSGDVLELGPGDAEWRVVARLGSPRFFHRWVTAGNSHLVALGGEGNGAKLAQLEVVRVC
jgi:hypothetical protein